MPMTNNKHPQPVPPGGWRARSRTDLYEFGASSIGDLLAISERLGLSTIEIRGFDKAWHTCVHRSGRWITRDSNRGARWHAVAEVLA
jgi:hypothetical protein